jgi:hypothetical protein
MWFPRNTKISKGWMVNWREDGGDKIDIDASFRDDLIVGFDLAVMVQ